MQKPTRRSVLALMGMSALAVGSRRAFAAPRPVVYLTWYGQSCFLLESAAGGRVVMDPLSANIGYLTPADLRADAVTISHEHQDHNNLALVHGKPKVLRGLTPDKKGWVKISEKVKDITIRSVGVYHDGKQGADIGLNTVFVFETGGVRVAHMGDLGHILTDQQAAAIGSVDVVLVPVGGVWTIDARGATEVVDQVRPRLAAVPMHYRTEVSTIKELATVEGFLTGRTHVRRETAPRLAITGMRVRPAAETVIMRFQ
jgi:L-ascorbate metabolism protein UlaG (beta-lactamase superfamily)